MTSIPVPGRPSRALAAGPTQAVTANAATAAIVLVRKLDTSRRPLCHEHFDVRTIDGVPRVWLAIASRCVTIQPPTVWSTATDWHNGVETAAS
jgi:hypothetical protein